MLRFAGRDFASQHLAIDWEGWVDIAGDDDARDVVKIRFRKANWLEVLLANLRHPNPAERLSYRIALLSFGLGLLAILLAVLR